MGNGYPKRKPFFAHRFVRLLAKVCAAQEIGIEAFALLTVIAHTEDARGYRSPVTFFNEQLVPLLGFGSVDSMTRARKRAIDGGWLHYEPGMRRKAGVYWVTIPDEYLTFDDAPSDEGYYRTGADIQTPVLPHRCGTKPEESAEPNQIETKLKPEESAEPSSLSLPLSLPQEKEDEKIHLVSDDSIDRHEASFCKLPFPDRFAEIVKRYPNKAPAKRAEAEWKLVATSEEVVLEIERGLSGWIECRQWLDGFGIPSLANFIHDRWFDNYPGKDNGSEADRRFARGHIRRDSAPKLGKVRGGESYEALVVDHGKVAAAQGTAPVE